ncbi:S49 family peptidase [Vibrio parahaemolyticus]|nr:S49 family peptidase [Vibrio parahaemolyticus]
MSNYQHLLTKAFNTPLAVDVSYARTFFSALAHRIGGVAKLVDVNGHELDAQAMQIEASSFKKERPTSRNYQVVDGIAIVPVDGSLVHKLGVLHPYSGMTGYDGILHKLNEAMEDDGVRAVMLDMDSPGGMVSGCFDLADVIAKYREIKPIWSLGYDMHCSAAQMIASSCSRRLITQTGMAGSVGVIMAHTNIQKMLEEQGTEITLIAAGKHKADGNPYEALPDTVRDKWQTQLESLRTMFATKAANYMGKDVAEVLATEAQVYEGQTAVDIGFADEIVNGADAVAIMSEHLSAQDIITVDMGATMTKPTDNPTAEQGTPPTAAVEVPTSQDKTAADIERERVLGILGLPEAKGREALAHKLAGNPAIDVAMATELLSVAPEANVSEAAALAAIAQEHGEPMGHDAASGSDDKDAAAVSMLVNS